MDHLNDDGDWRAEGIKGSSLAKPAGRAGGSPQDCQAGSGAAVAVAAAEVDRAAAEIMLKADRDA
ncbi:MAG: hypothetical protein ACK5PJ_08250, partial [Ralstonia sp.]